MHIAFTWYSIVVFGAIAGYGIAAGTTEANCPLRCPAGWVNYADSGTDHCYLFSQPPIARGSFWQAQSYCVSQQPTSYITEWNSIQENTAIAFRAFPYFQQFGLGPMYIWVGAYYENGTFHYVNGEPWTNLGLMINPLDPPKNGSCVFDDVETTAALLGYRSCDDPLGVALCEMSPIPDCSGETDPAATTDSGTDCDRPKSSDFVRQQQNGYLAVADVLTLTGMDAISCGVACMYHSGCFSFDISDSGECRLLEYSYLAACGGAAFTPDDSYQHYDMAFFAS